MLVRVLCNGSRKIANLRLPLRSLSDDVSNLAPRSDPAAISDTIIPADNILAHAAETVADSSALLLENGVSVLSAPSDWLGSEVLLLPSSTYQTLLDTVQVSTGMPWWGVLVGTACVLRAVGTFNSHMALERLLKHESSKMEMATFRFSARTTETGIQKKAVEWINGLQFSVGENRLLEVVTATKLSGVLAVFGILCLPKLLNYTAVSGLANIAHTPLVDCSFLWITSLAIPDPTKVLGFVNALLLHTIVRRTLKDLPLSEKINQMIFKKKWNFLSILSLMAIQANMPSCILLFWVSSNATSLLLVSPLLQTDWFRNKHHLLSCEERVRVVDKLRPRESLVQIATAGKCEVDDEAGEDYEAEEDEAEEDELEVLLQEAEEECKELETLLAEQRSSADMEWEELQQNMGEVRSEKKPCPIPDSASTEVLRQRLRDVAKRRARLNTFQHKVNLGRRKAQLAELRGSDTGIETKSAPKLAPYDRYLKKKESEDLENQLIEDIEYYERKIEK